MGSDCRSPVGTQHLQLKPNAVAVVYPVGSSQSTMDQFCRQSSRQSFPAALRKSILLRDRDGKSWDWELDALVVHHRLNPGHSHL